MKAAIVLKRDPYHHAHLALARVTWKAPFILPAQPCGMCGGRGTTPSPWGDVDLLVCEACNAAFCAGESEAERLQEEAATRYFDGVDTAVIW